MAAAIVWLQLKGLSDPEQVNYSSRWWITLSEPRFCLTPPVSAVCCAAHNSWRLFKLGHRELKPRRRGRQQERQKSNRFRLAKNNFARASRFYVDFFAVTVRLWRETSCPNFYVFWRTWTQDKDFLFIFLNFDSVLENSIPEKLANIWRTERDGISAINFEAARIHFPSDVFIAVAFVVA